MNSEPDQAEEAEHARSPRASRKNGVLLLIHAAELSRPSPSADKYLGKRRNSPERAAPVFARHDLDKPLLIRSGRARPPQPARCVDQVEARSRCSSSRRRAKAGRFQRKYRGLGAHGQVRLRDLHRAVV